MKPFHRGSKKKPHTQRGVAIVTAMLVTTLALMVVAGLFLAQQLQVQGIENQRLMMQRRWLLHGALDWSRLILREDAKSSYVDDLGEIWARPLPPTRMDQFLPSGTHDPALSDATLAGEISDAQSRLDINALASGGVTDPLQVQAFERLLMSRHIDTGLAAAIAEHVASLQRQPMNQSTPTLAMERPQDLLVIPGIGYEAVNVLRDHIAFLPRRSPLNLNTAKAEVLAASLPDNAAVSAGAIIAARKISPFKNIEDFRERMGTVSSAVNASRFGVVSTFFLVNGSLTTRHNNSHLTGLVERSGTSTRLWWVVES